MGLVAAGGITLGGKMAHRPASTGNQLVSTARLPGPYTLPLAVPEVLAPSSTSGDSDTFEITQQEASVEILPGTRTNLWTYDGAFPGPTIESRRGRPVTVTHRNELPVPTVVHLHGGVTPPQDDGYPTDLVLPEDWSGEPLMPDPQARTTEVTRDYTFPMDQRATMLWYHDHRMDFTAPAIWRGLAGMHIIRDDVEDALDLPRGGQELPLMIGDRAFHADGSLMYPALDPTLREHPGVAEEYSAGVLGDVILVNGIPWPVHEVDAVRHRLRLLNASNARHYELEAITDDGHRLELVQVGADQGLLGQPVTHDSLRLAPAERYDVIVDFAGVPVGSRVRLRNRLGTGATREVMAFRVARPARDHSHIPEILADDVPRVQHSQATALREFSFRAGQMMHGRGWVIGGKAFDPTRTDVRTSLGAVEVWRFVADVHHPIHLHLVGFQVLSRGGGPPLRQDAGMKDVISLRPGEWAEIITRFEGYRGRYLFHCHNAEHEDMGMMANLEIT